MRIRIAAALAVATGTTMLATPAHAATWFHRDARSDVVSLAAADDESLGVVVPDRREGDVLALRVKHHAGGVRATVVHDRLTRPSGDTQVVHALTIRTSGGKDLDVTLLADRDHLQGEAVERPCRGVRTRISYADDRVTVSVPRRCLGASRWVRVGAGSGTQVGDTLFADDALRADGLGHDVELGPRVLRD